MLIKHDYSYINNGNELIEKGYAQLDIHSLNFDRYYSEDEKQNNRKLSENMTSQEWNLHCDEISKEIYNKMLPIVNLLSKKYDIHNISLEKSTMEHYRENWDLHFYNNAGWNNKDHFDYMEISFNEKREAEHNKKLLDEILLLLEKLEEKNICCRVQYSIRENKEKITNKAVEICENLLEKTIEYSGMKGKIKLIDKDNKVYGFVKSRTRNHYYTISDTYLILNFAV